MLKTFLIVMFTLTVIITGCVHAPDIQQSVPPSDIPEYDHDADTPEIGENDAVVTIVSGSEAREIFEANESAILLDVRNQDEFDEIHIPGSILIPVDDLESRLSELPDKDTIIIVFCRAGRRSEIASDILSANGYTNIYDMQGISNWE